MNLPSFNIPFRTLLANTLTGNDNKTFDFVRVGGFILLLALIYFQWRSSDFNPINFNFASAGAAILAAIAGSDKLQATPLNRPSPEGPSTNINAERVTVR